VENNDGGSGGDDALGVREDGGDGRCFFVNRYGSRFLFITRFVG